METLTQTGPAYRTKCLTLEAASRFAKCLGANSMFAGISIETSMKAKSEVRYFVAFSPANPERVSDICDRQQLKRAETAGAEGAGYLWSEEDGGAWAWVFNPKSGETYEVSAASCTCPDYHYRCRHAGIACKHMIAFRSIK